MTSQNHTTAEALIATLETLAELADLVHRHRLHVAALREELSELADTLKEREALASIHADAPSQDRRAAIAQLALAGDGDYQKLRRRERELRREVAEREADIERARFRLKLTLLVLPVASAVDALDAALPGMAEEEDVP